MSPDRNQCETDITADAAHCGVCGNACAIGAVCLDSVCSGGAVKLASIQNGSPQNIAVNSRGVYWATSGDNQITTVELAGGPLATVATGATGCGNSGLPFALDDNNLYYWSNSLPCTGGGCNSGLADWAIPGGAVSSVASNSLTANTGCPSAMAIDGSHVYWLSSQSNNMTLMSVTRTGAAVSTLSTIVGGGSVGNALVVTRSEAIFISSQNGPTEIRGVNLSNPTPAPTTISPQLNGQSFGMGVFAANDNYLFLSSSGCCNNDQGNNNGILPIGRIDRFALDGSGGTNLAQFPGVVNAMVLDASFVYLATDSTIWKVPIAGGVAKRIAGNLTDGATPFQCDGSCYIPSNASALSIAVDAKNVYIADVSPGVDAILRVSK